MPRSLGNVPAPLEKPPHWGHSAALFVCFAGKKSSPNPPLPAAFPDGGSSSEKSQCVDCQKIHAMAFAHLSWEALCVAKDERTPEILKGLTEARQCLAGTSTFTKTNVESTKSWGVELSRDYFGLSERELLKALKLTRLPAPLAKKIPQIMVESEADPTKMETVYLVQNPESPHRRVKLSQWLGVGASSIAMSPSSHLWQGQEAIAFRSVREALVSPTLAKAFERGSVMSLAALQGRAEKKNGKRARASSGADDGHDDDDPGSDDDEDAPAPDDDVGYDSSIQFITPKSDEKTHRRVDQPAAEVANAAQAAPSCLPAAPMGCQSLFVLHAPPPPVSEGRLRRSRSAQNLVPGGLDAPLENKDADSSGLDESSTGEGTEGATHASVS